MQAELCPDRIADVTVAVTRRLRELGPALAVPQVVDWLDAQHTFTRDNDPDGYVEVQGIAEGFGIAADALFACFYGNVIADLASEPALADACTAWAAPHGAHGPVVVKNRDFRGRYLGLQCVFRHEDPEWAGRRILCVGSLGSPGAYSSGINTDGLAVADTQVGTIDHGEGWLRGFLMTRILRECSDRRRSGRAGLSRAARRRRDAAARRRDGRRRRDRARPPRRSRPTSRATAATSRAPTISKAERLRGRDLAPIRRPRRAQLSRAARDARPRACARCRCPSRSTRCGP